MPEKCVERLAFRPIPPHHQGMASDRSSLPTKVLMSLLIPAGAGFAVFVGLHFFFVLTWQRLFAWGNIDQAWWLNSGKSIAWTQVTLFFAALAVLSLIGATVRGTIAMWVGGFAGAIAMWVGVLVGTVSVLRAMEGDHNLFPIVIALGAAYAGKAIFLGCVVSAVGSIAVRLLRERQKKQQIDWQIH